MLVRSGGVVGDGVVWGELIDQLGHAHAALDRGIVLEHQLRSPLQPQLPCDLRLEHAVRGFEAGQARQALALAARAR